MLPSLIILTVRFVLQFSLSQLYINTIDPGLVCNVKSHTLIFMNESDTNEAFLMDLSARYVRA